MAITIAEFAKKYEKSVEELVSVLAQQGFESQLPTDVLKNEEEVALKAYVAGRSKPKRTGRAQTTVVEKPTSIELVSMTVGDFAERIGMPLPMLIVELLKRGSPLNKNQIMPEPLIEQIAKGQGIDVVRPQRTAPDELESIHAQSLSRQGSQGEKRLPVVVVIGHVDHGKTTLLDYVRNTRVAAREKGGITQHIGAYKAHTAHGDIVFIDTPGHEAFSMIRVRGLTVADVAILMVAADDGIMPQTVEAIKRAKAVGLPIIVALNKIDKVGDKNLDKVYQGLAQYDLLPEEWGGQTPCVKISALTGQGVDELLEMVHLQAELLDLKADIHAPATGYILESSLEKGRGPVATLILQHGMLRVGDHFSCGRASGKVTSLMSFDGKRVQEVGPSEPVRVAGFETLPAVGDVLKVGSSKDVRKQAEKYAQQTQVAARSVHAAEGAIKIIIKSDNLSTQEALHNAVARMSGKYFHDFYIISEGVGQVLESDIVHAADTSSIIYALHVKVDSAAQSLAQRLGVDIKRFDVIYKLLEELEELAEKGRPVKMVEQKIGEATVLKVFDIKNLGVIAGARVISGTITKDARLVVWRGKYKVGGGAIKSLQRDKKSVKEVHKGFECAFHIEGYSDWQPDDRVEAYVQVPEGA